jgi:prophage antirepressor-like protein
MAEKFIDYTNMSINYNGAKIYIIVDNNNVPWFNAKDIAKLLGYDDLKRAIQVNVVSENKKELQYIVEHYKLLYKNVQGKSLFINEKGLNELILRSNKKEAIEIQKWIANDVMPSLLKTGYYEMNNQLKKKSEEIYDKYKQIKKENLANKHRIEQLKNNQKGIKFYDKPCVYIIRLKKYDDKDMNKFGSAKNFNTRFPVYNTSTPDKMYVVDIIPVKDHKAVENAVKNMLSEYTYIKGKEYFQCSYNKLLEAIRTVVKFMENRDIDIESRKIKISKCSVSKKLSRESTEELESDSETEYDSDEDTELEELSDCENNFNKEFDNDAIENFEINSNSQCGGDFIGHLTNKYYIEKIYKYLSKIYNQLD